MKNRFFGHNFKTVYKFEVVRTLKKKSFWLMVLAFPVLIAAIFGLVYWAGTQSDVASENLAKEKFSIALTDESGTISSEMATQIGATTVDDKNAAITQVEAGKLDAYFYYPADLSKNRVEIYAQNVGIFENSKYQAVAQSLLQASALAQTDPAVIAVLSNQVNYEVQTYQEGKLYSPIMSMIAPAIFLVLFYLIICAFGGQMMNATVEEKENRVTEMILTTIKARTLIVGKILAFLTLILIQIVIIIGLVLVAYFMLRGHLNLPSFDLSQIPLDPARIAAGAAIFASAILLFAGILVAIGAAMPTAKEANQFLGLPMVLIFAPLYMAPMLITNTASAAISFVTFFPLTAPIPLMLRNAVGNLSAWETIVGVLIMAISAVVVFIVAARLFQTGAVEYSKKMSLKGLFRKKTA
jgi:ABC-2 type transport system permease protein